MPRGAKICPEMLSAHSLLWAGLVPAEAARKSGITQSSISKSKVCQLIIKTVRAAEQKIDAEPEASDEVLTEYLLGTLGMPEHHALSLIARRPGALTVKEAA